MGDLFDAAATDLRKAVEYALKQFEDRVKKVEEEHRYLRSLLADLALRLEWAKVMQQQPPPKREIPNQTEEDEWLQEYDKR